MVEAFSLENLPFEAYKASLDSSAIIGGRNADEYNTQGLAFINAVPDGKATTLDSWRDCIYNVVLENLVSNIHKGFATYFNQLQPGAGKRAQFVRLCAVAQAERTKKIWKYCFVRASLDHPAHKKMEGMFFFLS